MFYLGWNTPVPTWGTSMAFHRHFIEREGFTIAVATDNPKATEYGATYPITTLRSHPLVRRLKHSRFYLWAHTWEHLFGGAHVPRSLLRAAEEFRPDIILTSISSWSWLADLARGLSRKMGVPLVGSFNDWFDYYTIMAPSAKGMVERKFRRFYQSCDLALCTCEGMKEALGPHRNAIVHYPIGAERADRVTPRRGRDSGRFRIFYGGAIARWYGQMLEQLIAEARKSKLLESELEFVVCGTNPGWSEEFISWARGEGIYLGQLPFADFQKQAADADALILLMGFGEDCAQVERTSFKTKFLDYLSFGKPIIVWGPDYSSAVRTGREFDSAEVCTSHLASDCLAIITNLARDPARCSELVENARSMYEERFNPGKIHSSFRSACCELIG